MEVYCPHCNAVLLNDDNTAGRMIVCPTCNQQMQMPPLPPPVVEVPEADEFHIDTGSVADEYKSKRKRKIGLPKCPISDDDEVVCCPRCRSIQITAQRKGFKVGRAAVGFLVAGPLGLGAGFLGADVKLTCLKCGMTWTPGGVFSKAGKDRKHKQ